MNEWPRVPLAEFCQFSGGGKLGLNKGHYVKDGFPAFSAAGQDGLVSQWEFDQPGIVVSSIGARCGKAFLANDKWTTLANTYAVLPDTSTADAKFLWFQLNDESSWHRSGTGQPFIKPSDIKSRTVVLPPLAEQRRIVDLLSRAEGIVRLRREAQRKATELIPAIFIDLFGDPAANPNGWPVLPLSQCAQVISGVAKGRKLDPSESVELPYMRVANVKDGYLDLAEVKSITIKNDEVARLLIESGDLLMTEGGDPDKLGRAALWRGEIERCVHQNHVFKVRSDRSHVLPEYLRSLAGSTYGKNYFLGVAKKTTGIASINKTQLSAFPVVLAPVELQRAFVERVRSAEAISSRQTAALAIAQAAFEALLHRAFAG